MKKLLFVLMVVVMLSVLVFSYGTALNQNQYKAYMPIIQGAGATQPLVTPTAMVSYTEGPCGADLFQNWNTSKVTVDIDEGQKFWATSDWMTISTQSDSKTLEEGHRALTVSEGDVTFTFSGFSGSFGNNAPIFGCFYSGNFEDRKQSLLSDLAAPVDLVLVDWKGNITIIPVLPEPTLEPTTLPTATATLETYQEDMCGPAEAGGVISGWFDTDPVANPTVELPSNRVQTWVQFDSGSLLTSKGDFPVPVNTRVVVVSNISTSYVGVGTNGEHANMWGCAANMSIPQSRIDELVLDQSSGGMSVQVWDVSTDGSVIVRE